VSTIEEIARDALQAAHADLAKARRNLLLAAGVLALIHLLTVYPYLEASQEIAGVEASMAANAGLLDRLEPEIESLRKAGDSAGDRLSTLLDSVTKKMVDRFADLRTLVARATEGPVEEPAPPGPGSFPGSSSPPQAQMQQMPLSNLPPEPMQMQAPDFPPMQQMQQMQMQLEQAMGENQQLKMQFAGTNQPTEGLPS
jgi:hypothetical protein